jgi:MoxR-like ATPase
MAAAARAVALIRGRDYVMPKDVQAVASDVMSHRLFLTFDAVADEIDPRMVVDRIIGAIPPPQPIWNDQGAVAQPEFV